ncbi:MAG: ABC transporter substrate-binding protein [Caulobacteraceae bacterium]
MKKLSKLTLVLFIMVMAFSLVFTGCAPKPTAPAAGTTTPQAEPAKPLQIVLITMDSMDEHWLSVKDGAMKKAQELGNVEVIFRAPAGKSDPAEQTRMVEDAINQKVDAILLAASDAAALAPVVDKAYEAKIPLIFVDSAANTENYVSFAATDNAAAAALAADKMAELISGKGKIAIINAQAGAGTTMIRENGFKDRMKEKYPDVTIVTTLYCNGDKAVALNQTMDLLTANPDLVGIYACNEGATVGVARGLKEKGVAGKVQLVGFDKSKDIISGLEEGLIQATMVQNPFLMGSTGVDFAVKTIKGEKVEKKVDTGVKVVTKDNISEIK